MSTETCYYCSIQMADPKSAYKKTLYNKLDSNYGLGLTGVKKTTRFYEKDIMVPRCTSCAAEHNASIRPAGLWALAVLVISGVVTYVFAKRWYVALGVGAACGFAAMVAYWFIVYYRRLKQLGIKDGEDLKEYLPVKEMLDNGWDNFKP